MVLISQDAVRRQLADLGYHNCPDDVVREFLAELQQELDREAARPAPGQPIRLPTATPLPPDDTDNQSTGAPQRRRYVSVFKQPRWMVTDCVAGLAPPLAGPRSVIRSGETQFERGALSSGLWQVLPAQRKPAVPTQRPSSARATKKRHNQSPKPAEDDDAVAREAMRVVSARQWEEEEDEASPPHRQQLRIELCSSSQFDDESVAPSTARSGTSRAQSNYIYAGSTRSGSGCIIPGRQPRKVVYSAHDLRLTLCKLGCISTTQTQNRAYARRDRETATLAFVVPVACRRVSKLQMSAVPGCIDLSAVPGCRRRLTQSLDTSSTHRHGEQTNIWSAPTGGPNSKLPPMSRGNNSPPGLSCCQC